MIICKECQKEFDSERSLHGHIKAHKITQEEYYHKHYPRKDRFSGDLIKFKNKEYYFKTNFNTLGNMKKYFKLLSDEDRQKFFFEFITARKNEGKLKYALSEVETRTLDMPPLSIIIGDYKAYNKDCEAIGLKSKFNYKNINFKKTFKKEGTIMVDTREQKPLSFSKYSVQVQKLNFGDYCFMDDFLTGNVYIERKSLNDFIGTFGGDIERFSKELQRAKAVNHYLVVLVESTISNCMNYFRFPRFKRQKTANPNFVFHNVRHIMQNYNNIQFLFVNGRDHASLMCEKIFEMEEDDVRNTDLQLAYDLCSRKV